MWFKNLQLFNLDHPWSRTPGSLEERLARHPLAPCPALSLQSKGWVGPGESPALVQSLDRHMLIALGVEQKLLPAAVVNDAAKLKAEDWERQRGFKPGRKLMREFKDRAAAELLPRAFVRRRSTRAWIDPQAGRIVVDSGSPAAAELLVESLRDSVDELAVSLPQSGEAPGAILTAWLAAGRAPGNFELGEECELTGGGDTKAVVRYLRHPLQIAQIKRHLDEGFRVSRLALTWNGRVSLIVNDKLQLKRLNFLDIDENSEAAQELGPEQKFEADFALMTGEYGVLLDELLPLFGAATAAAPRNTHARGEPAAV
jgi:recombination associated protein RdgC